MPERRAGAAGAANREREEDWKTHNRWEALP